MLLNVCGIGKFVFLMVDFNMFGLYGLFILNFWVSFSNIVDNFSFEVFDDSFKLDVIYFFVLGVLLM